jgi:hypothetical protein
LPGGIPALTVSDMANGPDVLAGQRAAAALLAELLARGAAAGLPVVAWTVTEDGCRLVGQSRARPHSLRAGHIAAWRSVITAACGREPGRAGVATLAPGHGRIVAHWGDAGAGIGVTLTAAVSARQLGGSPTVPAELAAG